jgi:hypothetical protein
MPKEPRYVMERERDGDGVLLNRPSKEMEAIRKHNEAVQPKLDVQRRRRNPSAGSIATQGVAHSKRKTGPKK